jgi:hypothetical protein
MEHKKESDILCKNTALITNPSFLTNIILERIILHLQLYSTI